MNTLKRKLTAALLTLAMLLSLMPAMPQAAEAATGQSSQQGEIVTLDYSTGNADLKMTVKVYLEGYENEEPIDTITVNDAASAYNQIKISVNNDQNYEIADRNGVNVTYDQEISGAEFSSETMSSDLKSYSCTMNTAQYTGADNFVFTVILREPEKRAETPNGVEESTAASPQFRAYDAEIMKLLYQHDVDVSPDASTEIDSVVLNFRVPFGIYGESQNLNTPGEGLNGESDYCYFAISNNTGLAVPANIKSVTINYENNGETGSVTIPAGDLQLVYGKDVATPYYSIESNDDTVHVVYFYNEEDRNTGNAYYPYAVRFVEDGKSLGADMPENPTYNAEVPYNFVNWEYGNWDGTGKYFLSTTKVNDDLVVFAHKASLPTTGTEIRIMNPDSQLIERIAELSGYESSKIILDDKDGFAVSVYDDEGTMTQPGYLSNGWRDDRGYYLVHNYDADNPGDPEITNDKLSFEKVDGIYVYFKVAGDDPGKIHTVKIPVGNDTGYLTKMMGDGVTLLKLYIIQPGEVIDDGEEEPDPQPPADPTYDELKALIDVSVDCSTDGHDPKTPGLIENTSDKNDSYTLIANGNNATVTVHNGPYVAWYDGEYDGTSHSLAEDEEQNKTVDLTYDKDNGWKLADSEEASTTVHFDVFCSGTTPEPGEDITGLTKELVSTAEAAVAAVGTSAGYAFPEHGVVVIPNGGTVKLLYSITVEGTANTTFTVTDTGAELVEVEDIDVEDGTDPDTFTGTIPDSGNITFYVAKTFDGSDIENGKLTNTASIDPNIADPEVNTPAEEEPALPGEEWLNENFDVELDCTSGVGHNDETYHDLIENSYNFENLTYVEQGSFTVDLIVNSELYVDNFDEMTSATHQNDGEATKTIELTFENNAWTAPENSSPIEFDVKCSGTGDYDINGIAKDLVAGESDKATAVANGVTDFDGLTIPEEGETVIIPAGGSVTLLYSITVIGGDKAVGFEVEDKDTTLIPSEAAVTQDKTTGIYSGTIPANGRVTFYVSKTFTGDDLENGKLVNRASVDGANAETKVDPDPDVDEEVDAVEAVGITPADITIYEGGNGYGGVLGADGNIIAETKSSGLPEPGYFITLPDDVQKWLQEQSSEIGAEDLSQNMTFTYEGADGITTRTWELVYHGVYETDGNETPLRYVYGLTPATVGDETIPVRLNYFDDQNGNGKADDDEIITSDEITMAENLASDTFQMTINPGELDQSQIQATFKVGEETKEYPITIGTGTLTVKSVVDEEAATNAIATDETGVDSDTLTAVADADVEYFVNDSEVKIDDADRVQLLVDEVSNNDDFNAEMGQDAIETVEGDASTHGYELAYMDLVDVNNGHAEVTLGNGDSLTIYWPMPEDADETGEFQVVHYTGMDREKAVDDLDAVTTEQPEVTKVTINDQDYLTFTTTGFSPFALVYEKANGGQNPGDNDPWYPWHPGGSGDGPDGLNTEDHFSYVVGYEDGNVKPNNQITRAEVATIFYRLLEDEVRDDYDTTRNNFSDVTSDSWYNQTVSTLASMGILKGYEDGTFRPNEPITRAEFGAIATRFFAETGATYEPGTFSDVTGDEWYANAIQDAVNLGLIGGYEDGTVRPNNNITRAEACAIVNRTLGRVPDADHLLPDDVMKTWPDNPESAWFYADMQEATNGHEYEWITEDGNKIEEWTDILDKDWNDR